MTQRIIACVLYTQKHIRIEKHTYLPDLVDPDSLVPTKLEFTPTKR